MRERQQSPILIETDEGANMKFFYKIRFTSWWVVCRWSCGMRLRWHLISNRPFEHVEDRQVLCRFIPPSCGQREKLEMNDQIAPWIQSDQAPTNKATIGRNVWGIIVVKLHENILIQPKFCVINSLNSSSQRGCSIKSSWWGFKMTKCTMGMKLNVKYLHCFKTPAIKY